MTFRAIIIGLLSAGLLGLATPYADLVIQGSDMVDSHMPLGPITLLMVLVLVVNTALRRVRQQWAFTRQELATIYIMTLASAALPSNDAFERLAPVIAGAFYFPPQGTLQPVLTRYVSPWATIRDPTAIKYFFEGLPEGQPIPWASWVALLISWTTFGMLLYAQYYFVAVLLRRRWVDEERLTFPLAQVPLTILEGERPSVASPLFRNSIFWIGFGGVFVLHSLNGLHYYFGFIPEIKLTAIPIGQSLQNRPWDALKDVQIYVYFSMIGLAYLISGEVAISLWGFYWLYQIQGVVFRAYGMEIGGATGQFNALTFWRGQELGGFVALGAFVLWSARHQLLAGARAFSKRDEADPMAPGWAAVGVALTMLLGVLWSTAAGMQWGTALVLLTSTLLAMLCLARLTCAGGIVQVDVPYMPSDVINSAVGSRNLTPGSQVIMHFQQTVWWTNWPSAPLPLFMDSLRISQGTRLSAHRLTIVIALAAIAAIAGGYFCQMKLAYTHGGLSLDSNILYRIPNWNITRLRNAVETGIPVNKLHLWSALGGLIVTSTLIHLQRNYLWWPISPLGYLMGSSTSFQAIWFSILIGWAASALMRRFTGLHGYSRLRPLFLGLVLGEFVTAGIWIAIDGLTGVRMHKIFPGA
jgi:hypothetical protein